MHNLLSLSLFFLADALLYKQIQRKNKHVKEEQIDDKEGEKNVRKERALNNKDKID